MVKLAKWGAVAGLGKGMVQNAETAVDRENKILDEQRDTRLEDLRNKNAIKRDLVRSKEDRKNTELEITGRETLQGQQIDATAAQGVLDRASRESQTTERAGATVKSAEINAASSKSKAKRWTTKTTKGGSIMTKTGIQEFPELIKITDADTAETYTQLGDRLLPQGNEYFEDAEGKIKLKDTFRGTVFTKVAKGKEAAAEAWLLEDRSRKELFMKTYGYLPLSFMKSSKQ